MNGSYKPDPSDQSVITQNTHQSKWKKSRRRHRASGMDLDQYADADNKPSSTDKIQPIENGKDPSGELTAEDAIDLENGGEGSLKIPISHIDD